MPLFKNAKEEAVQDRFKQPKRIIVDEIKKNTEMTGRDMPNIENATRVIR